MNQLPCNQMCYTSRTIELLTDAMHGKLKLGREAGQRDEVGRGKNRYGRQIADGRSRFEGSVVGMLGQHAEDVPFLGRLRGEQALA